MVRTWYAYEMVWKGEGSVKYLLWAVGVLLIVTGLWPLVVLLAIPVLFFTFGAVVFGMALHDEEKYLREKFDIEEKQEDD